MEREFIKVLVNWPRAYISGTDLHQILNKSDDSRYSIVKRAVQAGYLLPIKRDLYLIKSLNKPFVNSFEIAPIIYGPSYISFESALSYHGWIPEGVRTITCASTKRDKELETPIGIFSYEQIPLTAFSLEVEQRSEGLSTLFIASPIKALADIIYKRKKTWESVVDLSEDFRIEMDNFKKKEKQAMEFVAKNYPSLRVKKVLNHLLNSL